MFLDTLWRRVLLLVTVGIILHGDHLSHGGRSEVACRCSLDVTTLYERQVRVLELPAEAEHLLGEHLHGGHGGVVGRHADDGQVWESGLRPAGRG